MKTSEHMIVTCTLCKNVWDMDMEPDACTCHDLDESIEFQMLTLVQTNDWRAAVKRIADGL